MSNEMNTVNQKNTQTPVEQTADGRYKVTKRDLRRTAARYNFMACNIFNYEQHLPLKKKTELKQKRQYNH